MKKAGKIAIGAAVGAAAISGAAVATKKILDAKKKAPKTTKKGEKK